MTNNNKLAGFIFAFSSVVFASLYYPILKSVMRDLSAVQVALLESLICVIIYGIYFLKNASKNIISRQILLIGFVNGLGCLFLFMAIGALNPAIMGLMGRIQLVFAMIFSFVIFNERLKLIQILLSTIIIICSFLFAYKGLGNVVFSGILMAFIYCFLFAVGAALFKKHSLKIKTSHVILVNKAMAFIIILVYLLVSGNKIPFNASLHDVLLITIAAASTVIFGLFLFLESLKYLHFSMANLIRATSPIFVFLFSIPFFPINLTSLNIIGGSIAFISIIILIFLETTGIEKSPY